MPSQNVSKRRSGSGKAGSNCASKGEAAISSLPPSSLWVNTLSQGAAGAQPPQ